MTDKLVLLNPHNGRRGVPEAFQVVVGALIRREDVDDDVAVIEQDPARFRFAFFSERLDPVLRDSLRDSVDYRLKLTDCLAAGEHEIIGEGRDITNVQQENVFRLPLRGRVDYLARQLVGFQTPSSSFRFVFPRRITL